MTRYAVERVEREGEELLLLRDAAHRAAAHVWPGCGNNCLSAVLTAPDGQLVTVIQTRRRWTNSPPAFLVGYPVTVPVSGLDPRRRVRVRGAAPPAGPA